jgi:hypothetical protein
MYALCHKKCKLVHEEMKNAHAKKQHLAGYEDMPVLRETFCFRIGVKRDVPLYGSYDIARVSISVPPDAMGNRGIDRVSEHNLPSTIEIALVDEAGELSYDHPLISGSGVERFDNVASLLRFLDELANYST